MPDPQGLHHRTCGILRRAVRTSSMLVREQLPTCAGEGRSAGLGDCEASNIVMRPGRCLHSCTYVPVVCLSVCVSVWHHLLSFFFCYLFTCQSSYPVDVHYACQRAGLSLATMHAAIRCHSVTIKIIQSPGQQMFLGDKSDIQHTSTDPHVVSKRV